MSFAENYFSRQADFVPFCNAPPAPNLGLVVMIPCHREPFVLDTLKSLASCILPPCGVEVIVVINSSANATSEVLAENQTSADAIVAWLKSGADVPWPLTLLHLPALPPRHAGVGLARKRGMDEAAWRFHQLHKPEGIIVSLDADATVDQNYLCALYSYFHSNPKSGGASVYFEHADSDPLFDIPLAERIAGYELHLRYVVQAMRYAGLPYGYHTVGSSFAVRASLYTTHGGMNRRQAGEDFYFLHKIIPDTLYGEVNDTVIHLSPRPSDRVPFGTGAAVGKLIAEDAQEFATYRFDFFVGLRQLTDNLYKTIGEGRVSSDGLLYNLPQALAEQLELAGIADAVTEIAANTSGNKAFVKRFFKWFDAFRMVKVANALHLDDNPRVPVAKEAAALLSVLQNGDLEASGQRELLDVFRNVDRKGWTNPLR